MEKRVVFGDKLLPYLLLAAQLAVIAIFFYWPAGEAVWQSLFLPDAFGLSNEFVGLENFERLIASPFYRAAFWTTAVFSASVTVLSMGLALWLAVLADRVTRGALTYRTLIIWPYAVAPAVAGVLWLFMFNPGVGVVAFHLRAWGVQWNHVLRPDQAMLLVVLAAAWQQVSYNFLFFLAGLQSIPKSLNEAAAIDGAGFWRRFRDITLPLLSPTIFFLLVVNIIYAFFDTFGVIHVITAGGPQQATTTLVYKVYRDGFVGQDLGSSAAQSVILLAIVAAMTIVQFRYVEKKVHY